MDAGARRAVTDNGTADAGTGRRESGCAEARYLHPHDFLPLACYMQEESGMLCVEVFLPSVVLLVDSELLKRVP
jgi:hypothetical protein